MLWLNAVQNRYFAVPEGVILLTGEFTVQNLDGITKKVDEIVLTQYEVTEHEAKRYFRGGVRPISKLVTDTLAEQSDPDAANILDEQIRQTPTDPAALNAELRGFFNEMADLLEIGQRAETMGDTLRELLQKVAGQDAQLDPQLSKLAQVFDRSKGVRTPNDPFVKHLIAVLRKGTSQLESSPDEVDLDQLVQFFDQTLGESLGINKQKTRAEEKWRREIRAQADEDIANSLRAFGFKTKTDDDNDSA